MDKLDWLILLTIPLILLAVCYLTGYYHELYMIE